jgi:glycosyltransferase domain-containing protein
MITLLIPTMNRSDFLIRLLRYYEDTGFDGYIYIADGSNPYHVERTKRVIESLTGRFTIVYNECPDVSIGECLKLMIDAVGTSYVEVSGDDDFLVPHGLNACMDFLDAHPDYAFAHGTGVNLALDIKGSTCQITDCSCYERDEMESNSAAERLDYYLRRGHITSFSVFRTEHLRQAFHISYALEDVIIGGELLPCCYAIVLGKSKLLDCFHVVRTGHAQQFNIRSGFDWIASPGFSHSYQAFQDSLSDLMARQDSISKSESEKIIKSAFCAMLNTPGFLCHRQSLSSGVRMVSNHNQWVRVGRAIPGAQRIWQFLHSFSGVSLSALLRPSSPYHADFMPVYKALITPIIKKK